MAQNTDLNVSPYYDDYDETKDFHRILFRPANAIQARELTQLQSILQNQTEKFGNHVFKEGSLVMGGTITVNKEYYAVKMNDGNPNGSGETAAETYRAAAVGKYYQGKVSKTVGKCINTAATTTDDDPLTLFFNIVQSGNPTGTTYYSTFTDNEEIEEVALDSAGVYSNASNSNNEFRAIVLNATATGSAATVRSGVFYTRGFFVRCPEQTILLDKYTNTPTYRIGLQVEETLISSTDDTSLLDNATGTSNENAPGANRLKIALTFVKKAIGGTQDIDNFIELSRVEAGIITKQKDISTYNVLERTLARRTFDESGDYVIKPYQLQLREHLNSRTNNGVYLSTNTVTAGDKTKFVGVISPGKAYVKGFEVEKPSQNLVTFSKARTTKDAGALAVPFEIGNYYHVINVFGQPDFGTADNAVTPFGPVELTDTTTTAGTKGGTTIGRARVRYFNCTTPTVASGVHTAASIHRIYLFDVRMYTKLTVASTSYALTAGQRVKGSSSGAKGTVAEDVGASGTTAMLIDVEGTFNTSDYLRLEKDTSGGKLVSAVKAYSSDRVRQIYQTYSATAGAGSRVNGAANFTCEPVTTDNQFVITGTMFSLATNDKTVKGVNSKFTQELKNGDVIIPPGGTSIGVVDTITSDIELELVANAVAVETGKFIRQRAQLQEQEKTVAIAATPKDFVSSLTPNSMIIRKQASSQLNGSGAGTVAGVGDEVLVAEPTTNAGDYSITIMEDATGGDALEGKVIDITEHATVIAIAAGSGGAISLSSTNSTAVDVSDQLKIIYAATKDVENDNAAKTIHRARGVAVTTPASTGTQSTIYGTNYDDEIITLGVPDAYAIRAVFESNDTTGAIPNKLTLASGFGTSKPGQKLTGSVTGAVGRVIQHSSNDIYFYYTSKVIFTTADTVTNEHNTNTTTNSRVCTAVTLDSKDISGNFLLDTGQRDGYYGLSSLKRRAGTPKPQNPIVIIFDYFKSAGGSFHTVDSYSGNADAGGPALQYENIPIYKANIFDPLGIESDGEFELTDAVDFRSYVHSLHNPSAAFDVSSVTDVSGITIQPFNYTSEEFTSARAVTFDLPQSTTSMSTTVMSHYLPRIDKISLSSGGQFITSTGEPAEYPAGPSAPASSILLHTLYIPPFTSNLARVAVRSQDHKRFTMKDIGKIQGRVKNLERVTSFNALEQQTNLQNIKDADGLDRFKSGFVTDNFRGHRTGNVFHPDYKIGVNRTTGTLRPQHNARFVEISLNTSKSAGYTKTGDLITLPFTETPYITIDKASLTEYVNPYNVVIFNGTVTLSPSKDMWFDTERLPGIRRTVMGDYDTVVAGVANALGTVWNNWQTDWIGEPVVTVTTKDITTTPGAPDDDLPSGKHGHVGHHVFGIAHQHKVGCHWGGDWRTCEDEP